MPLTLGQPTQLPHEVDAGHALGQVHAQLLGGHDHGGAIGVHDLAAAHARIHLGIVTHLQQLVGVHADQVGEAPLLDEGIGRLDGLPHRPGVDGGAQDFDSPGKINR